MALNPLNDAVMEVLMQRPEFGKIAQDTVIDPQRVVKVLAFDKPQGHSFSETVQVKDPAHYAELCADSTINKLYVTDKLIPQGEYLPYMLLGIHYLEMTDHPLEADKGRAIFERQVQKEREALYRKRGG